MKNFDGKVAAITGAASGIGRSLAVALAEQGCDLALSDIQEQEMGETAALARRQGAEVTATVVDVAEREAVERWADAVADHFGRVNLIFNNAGVSVSATVEGLDYEDFEWLMDINFWGVVHGTKAFMPYLRESGEGHVINISSLFGIIALPTQSAYNASKFAVRGFTESLRAELDYEEGPVSCTSVHPGGVKTNIANAARIGDTGVLERSPGDIAEEFNNELARLSPEDAAEQILDAVRADRRRVLVGGDAKILEKLQRLMPSGYIGGVVGMMKRKYKNS
ncbi:MAG: SDR family NAD(P)-dependent oxidoreductase [Myxococcota bacterium]